MSPSDPMGVRATSAAAVGATDENSRLDTAIRRADEILFDSLKSDERRRYRRNVTLFVLGGMIMVAALSVMIVLLAGELNAPPTAAQTADADKAAALSADGWKQWSARNFAQAVGKFEQAVKLDPQNTAAWNGLGWSNFNQGNYGPADEAFRQCVILEPNFPAALNGLGQLALAQRKYDSAEEYLLKAAPNAPAAWYGLARVYLLGGKYEDAEKWCEKLINSGEADEGVEKMLKAAKAKNLPADLRREIEPSVAQADISRGWQLMNQGRRAEAKAIFEAAIAKDAKDPSALNGMGWLLLNGGNAAEAKEYFQKTLAADPQASGAMNGLARALNAQGDTDAAITIWEKMVKNVSGVHAGTYGLANAYFEKKEFAKALPLLKQIAESDPTDAEIQKKLKQAESASK